MCVLGSMCHWFLCVCFAGLFSTCVCVVVSAVVCSWVSVSASVSFLAWGFLLLSFSARFLCVSYLACVCGLCLPFAPEFLILHVCVFAPLVATKVRDSPPSYCFWSYDVFSMF